MNILTSTLPDYLTISGQKCKIRADFKTWLTFSNIVSNGEMNTEKAVKICALIFYELPPNFNEAFREILKFYRCLQSRQSIRRRLRRDNNTASGFF